MEKIETSQESRWTSVDIWSALVEIKDGNSKSENIKSVIDYLSEKIGDSLISEKKEELVKILNAADPDLLWNPRLHPDFEGERRRVQGEILRVLKPL